MANGAYSFDGSNDGISFSHPSAFDGLTKLTAAMWIDPTASAFYDVLLACIGDFGTGAGNNTGFGIQHSGSDETSLFLVARNLSSSQKVKSGVLTSGIYQPIWIVYDGTQATATNRLRAWVSGSEITSWDTDSNDFPTSLGTNDQLLTLGYDVESGPTLFSHGKIADVGLLFGRAITDGTIASHAAGMSIGNYVQSGDLWCSFRVDQNDENGGRTGTLVDVPTLVNGPSLTFPGGSAVKARRSSRGTLGINLGVSRFGR